MKKEVEKATSTNFRAPAFLCGRRFGAASISLAFHGLVVIALSAQAVRTSDPAQDSQPLTTRLFAQSADPFLAAESVQTDPVVHPPAFLVAAAKLEPASRFAEAYRDGGHQPSVGPSAAAPKAPAPSGNSFFNIATQNQRIIFVLDTSASMGRHGAWQTAAAEVQRCVRRLPATSKFQIIVYSNQARSLSRRLTGWLQNDTETIALLTAALAHETAEGVTNHLAGLQRALVQGAEAIFFLTDADDLTPEQARQIQLSNRSQTVIHAVELRPSEQRRGEGALEQLAKSTGGVYRCVRLLEP